MDRAHRLEERLADVEYLDRAVIELRPDLALGDVGSDRTGMITPSVPNSQPCGMFRNSQGAVSGPSAAPKSRQVE